VSCSHTHINSWVVNKQHWDLIGQCMNSSLEGTYRFLTRPSVALGSLSHLLHHHMTACHIHPLYFSLKLDEERENKSNTALG